MFQTLRSNAVVELFLPLQNPVGHHFLTTEQLEHNHSPALCFIITDSGSCRAVQAADCKNAYYRAQQCFCALEWCITAVTSIPTVRVWNPIWEIVVSKRMQHHSQYSSAVQGLHMCEDLRCNLQLKQMTVWTDEADQTFWTQHNTKALQLLFHYTLHHQWIWRIWELSTDMRVQQNK